MNETVGLFLLLVWALPSLLLLLAILALRRDSRVRAGISENARNLLLKLIVSILLLFTLASLGVFYFLDHAGSPTS
ncbi:MAG: hypothetical protein FWD77_00260 [Betaproteobacteria bacterium]|nr:hypothetical protein [Betaproteobacteria bacterium]